MTKIADNIAACCFCLKFNGFFKTINMWISNKVNRLISRKDEALHSLFKRTYVVDPKIFVYQQFEVNANRRCAVLWSMSEWKTELTTNWILSKILTDCCKADLIDIDLLFLSVI